MQVLTAIDPSHADGQTKPFFDSIRSAWGASPTCFG